MKYLADALTGARLVLVAVIAWIALAWERATGHSTVALLTMLAWTTDTLDGPLARRARIPTRLGRYDLPIDVGLTGPGAVFSSLGHIVAAGGRGHAGRCRRGRMDVGRPRPADRGHGPDI
ncbi:MAG: hypothetical protein B6I34_10085 [Anaerolineaceae bacterium 4572_32.1]|nr:MAG: hypothetical protein B6I34_10085 [Anaerolineaceae bacterium 4572_32.1]